MCGISGALIRGDTHRAKAAVEATLPAMRHRGPDDCGLATVDLPSGCVTLGSTRLAIIDLSSAGHMPMRDDRTGNLIVYNGEVYNFRDLRRALEDAGDIFYSTTDTEVVLKAYGRWGADCVRRFRGMYAFAIWDAAERNLFIARDPAGKKPLYFAARPDGFLFASEVRALLATGCCERKIDTAALSDFLFNGFCVAPRTLVDGILSLLPGHAAWISEQGTLINTFNFAGSDECDIGSAAPTLDELTEYFDEAVRLRLVSDVPLGAFLSGGLDSSGVVAAMSRHASDVRTFSIGFEERPYDESSAARAVAEKYGTRHHEMRLGKTQFLSWLSDGLAAMDLPTFDGINTYFVARAARAEGLTVALSGIGADELFGGYPFFRTIPWMATVARWLEKCGVGRLTLRSILKPELRHLSSAWKLLDLLGTDGRPDVVIRAYQTAQMLFPSWARQELRGTDLSPGIECAFGLPAEFLRLLSSEVAACNEPWSAISLLASRLFLGERCLRDTDQMSMAVSLEVRAPFVDRNFSKLAMRVPSAARCAEPPNKPFERRLLHSLLGDGLGDRPKQGFVFPFEVWMRDESVSRLIAETLLDRQLVTNVGFDFRAVARLLDYFDAHERSVRWSRIWAVFVILTWCRRHRISV